MGLVQYDSSDEDEEIQTSAEAQPPKPSVETPSLNLPHAPEPAHASPSAPTGPHQNATHPPPNPGTTGPELGPVLGPARGPSLPDPEVEVDISFLDSQPPANPSSIPDEPPRSPYTTTRTLLRDLTLPAVPNMDIPPSPPGTPPPTHDALTAKFDSFLRLKRTRGIHFNERLAASAGMRNPALMDKLLGFVGIETELDADAGDDAHGRENGGESDGRRREGKGKGRERGSVAGQYATVLSGEVWDPGCFPAWAYRGALRTAQEQRAKERERKAGEPVEFVAAGAGTTEGTPSGPGTRSGTPGVGSRKRKGRFDT